MNTALSSEFAPPQARRIRVARELRGLTQQEAVGLMEHPISPAALSQIESGRVRPTRDTMMDLALALEVPVTFFTAQWFDGSVDGRLPPTFFRDLRGTSARERKRASANATLLNDLIAALEVHVRLPEVRIPKFSLSTDASCEQIDETAAAVRQAWKLNASPIPHVVREMERHGVVVARLTLGSRDVDAFSVGIDRRPLVLLTEDKSNYVRSRFDAAHELGHLVMHRGATPGTRSVETQAQDFASSFLLPRAIAEEELPRRLDPSGWARLAELKSRWGISIAAMLFKARKLHVLSVDAYGNAVKYMSAKGWRTTEPGDREMGPPEAPLILERAIRTIHAESGINIETLAEEASLPIRDVLQLLQAAADRRPKVEL